MANSTTPGKSIFHQPSSIIAFIFHGQHRHWCYHPRPEVSRNAQSGNAECGMKNEETKLKRGAVSRIVSSFFILHFSFIWFSVRASEPFSLRTTNAPSRVVIVRNHKRRVRFPAGRRHCPGHGQPRPHESHGQGGNRRGVAEPRLHAGCRWHQGLRRTRRNQRHAPGGRGGGDSRTARRGRAGGSHCHLGQARGRFARCGIFQARRSARRARGGRRGCRLRPDKFLQPRHRHHRQSPLGRFGIRQKGRRRRTQILCLRTGQPRLTKIISVAPLLNDNDTGVCGHLYSLAMASVDNTFRFEGDPDRLAVAVPEIYALPALGDRVVLNITDALIGQYEGGSAACCITPPCRASFG